MQHFPDISTAQLHVILSLLACIIHFSALISHNILSIYRTATNISFSQSMYSVNENEGPVEPVLVLSNPSSSDITVRVTDRGGTATGKHTIYVFVLKANLYNYRR